MEFHESSFFHESEIRPSRVPEFPCIDCSVTFHESDALKYHRFTTHPSKRPKLFIKSNELGSTRESVSHQTSKSDWRFENQTKIKINGQIKESDEASEQLSSTKFGYVEVELFINQERSQLFQLDFNIADESDIQGVEDCLDRFIDGGELSKETIAAFIDRSKVYQTAMRYTSGIAEYFYGVLAREQITTSEFLPEKALLCEEKFNSSTNYLKNYTQPAAMSICALVAFHLNHFQLARTKARGPKLFLAASKMQALLINERIASHIPENNEIDCDSIFSDSTNLLMQDLAIAIDETDQFSSLFQQTEEISRLMPVDKFKLAIICAEHHALNENFVQARFFADILRHNNNEATLSWYTNFRKRIDK